MTETTQALLDYGALGTILAAVLAVCVWLIRDLIAQRNRSQELLGELTASVDKLATTMHATHEVVRTTNELFTALQRRNEVDR